MSPTHLINRVCILGTGLIGGSFALALRKYTEGVHITAWDRADTVARTKDLGAADEIFHGELKPALQSADLVYVALPISTTLDVLPEIARHSAQHALVTDACSTKVRIVHAAEELFSGNAKKLFLGGHPMAGKESSGIANADANLFRDTTYALIGESSSNVDEQVAPQSSPGSEPVPSPARRAPIGISKEDPRVAAFVKIIGKIGARPLWLGAQQHDYAVGLASHLPQLAAVALASFLYDHSAGLDLFTRRLDELRDKLASRELEADFDAANELYKLLRSF
jgi:prephenate dehydrogenase